MRSVSRRENTCSPKLSHNAVLGVTALYSSRKVLHSWIYSKLSGIPYSKLVQATLSQTIHSGSCVSSRSSRHLQSSSNPLQTILQELEAPITTCTSLTRSDHLLSSLRMPWNLRTSSSAMATVPHRIQRRHLPPTQSSHNCRNLQKS